MKVHPLAGTIASICHLTSEVGKISVSALGQPHRQRINHALNLRLEVFGSQLLPVASNGWEGLFSQIQARDKCLIRRHMGKELSPIINDELINRFLLKQIVQMGEQVESDKFLVSQCGLGVIAQALKTGLRLSIVNMTDKQI
jgi:hypothetical protein